MLRRSLASRPRKRTRTSAAPRLTAIGALRFPSLCHIPPPGANVVAEASTYANVVKLAIIGMNGIVGQCVLTAKFLCDLRQNLFKSTVLTTEHIVRYRVRPSTAIRRECLQHVHVDGADATEATPAIETREIGSRKNT